MAAARGPARFGVVVAVVLGGVVVAAVTLGRPRRMVVEGPSMEPTLKAGDRLLVVRKRSPRTGDIVAFADPRGTDPGGIGPRRTERLLVKRVVQVVGTSLVVEGDNRGASTDSRTFGSVEKAAVVGRALYRYGPAGRTGLVV